MGKSAHFLRDIPGSGGGGRLAAQGLAISLSAAGVACHRGSTSGPSAGSARQRSFIWLDLSGRNAGNDARFPRLSDAYVQWSPAVDRRRRGATDHTAGGVAAIKFQLLLPIFDNWRRTAGIVVHIWAHR